MLRLSIVWCVMEMKIMYIDDKEREPYLFKTIVSFIETDTVDPRMIWKSGKVLFTESKFSSDLNVSETPPPEKQQLGPDILSKVLHFCLLQHLS